MFRAVVLAALLVGSVATAVPASADPPLPCRVYVYPPEFYYTPWGELGYVTVAPPYVDCT